MNGFISNATILSIVFSSITFLSSLTYAANTTAAGCMGCHQGETTAVNEPLSKSSHNQDQQDQKSKDTLEVSKHTVQQG